MLYAKPGAQEVSASESEDDNDEKNAKADQKASKRRKVDPEVQAPGPEESQEIEESTESQQQQPIKLKGAGAECFQLMKQLQMHETDIEDKEKCLSRTVKMSEVQRLGGATRSQPASLDVEDFQRCLEADLEGLEDQSSWLFLKF